MSDTKLNPDVLRHLNIVLRLQLMAVKQHFIHVLTLEAWGDPETAAGITAIDSVDLPNAMRIVDFIISSNALPELCDGQQCLAEHMPTPGSTYEEIFAAERRLEKRLIRALHAGENATSAAGMHTATNLTLDPISPRKRYEEWIENKVAEGLRSAKSTLELSAVAQPSLNTLFAHLMVVIEQGLIHSFVHWHGGEWKLADTAWEVSGAAMMQATEITKLLATCYSAPAPAEAVVSNTVMLPNIGSTSDEAIMFDRALAERVCATAKRATEILSETKFEPVCRDCEAYFRAARDWQPGLSLPEITNPCRDFERMLREYVWKDGGTGLATA